MLNPLFTGLVAYVIREMDGYEVDNFKEDMEAALEELHEAEVIEELEWFDELKEHWLDHLEEDEIDNNFEEFKTAISTIDPAMLLNVAVDLRNEIMLESLPELTYKVTSFHAVYFVRWQDGLQIEYTCRPILRNPKLEYSNHFIGSVNEIFRQQLVEMLISPNLDALHDQIAKPFDFAKLNELVNVLHDYVGKLPAERREDYEQVIERMKKCFGPGPKVQLKRENNLEWLDNGGGF